MDLSASAASTPPPPISDLQRMHLCYQTITPVPSVASSQEDLDYSWCSTVPVSASACGPLYPPSTLQKHHVHHAHHAHHAHAYAHDHHHLQPSSHPYESYLHHQQVYQQYPYIKAEHGGGPYAMADIPHAAAEDVLDDVLEDAKDGLLEMDQEEVDAIIRNKRKVRDPKACYACHRRKVKCDRNLPCDSCVKRDHPELCSYERPTKKRRIVLSGAVPQADPAMTDASDRAVNSGPNITVPREQWERMKQELAQLKERADRKPSSTRSNSPLDGPISSAVLSQSDDGDHEGVHAPSNQMGTMHLGSRSVLAYMLGNRSKSTQDAARSLLEENILPNLGLDNETTTYPFVDLWSTDSSMSDVTGLMKALPEDSLCREFWLTYRDIPCTIYPVVPDKQAFGQTLEFLLRNRQRAGASGNEINPDRPYDVPMSWLALLFAVLASGSQSTGRPAKERELTSQVYICCSYQALRMSNFMTHPSLDTMQALLIIGNALSYNMNPGVSYILLGMTLRSAFSIGLHVQPQRFSGREAYLRGRIWWALAWQDSHFSVSYDRPSASILCIPDIPYDQDSHPGARSYVESMSAIIRLTQEILRERMLDSKGAMAWSHIQRYKDEVHNIWLDALPRFRDRTLCVSMTDHLERLALQLHCSYLTSEVCRPALKEDHSHHQSHTHQHNNSPVANGSTRRKSSLSSQPQPNNQSPTFSPIDPEIVQQLRATCIRNLEQVVDTYVELRAINKFAARSWIGIQRSISAAFLLGILPETKKEPRVIRLLTDLEKGIEEAALEDSGFSRDMVDANSGDATSSRISSAARENESPQWVKSMTKSLSALSKLNATLASSDEIQPRSNKQPTQQHLSTPPVYGYAQSHSLQQGQHPQLSLGLGAPMYNTLPPRSVGVPSPPGRHIPQPNTASYPPTMFPHGPGRLVPVSPDQNVVPTGPASAGGSEWNFGNMAERALEHVAPGIWG